MLRTKTEEFCYDSPVWERLNEAKLLARQGYPGQVREALQEAKYFAHKHQNGLALLAISAAEKRLVPAAYDKSTLYFHQRALEMSNSGNLLELAHAFTELDDNAAHLGKTISGSLKKRLVKDAICAAVSNYIDSRSI